MTKLIKTPCLPEYNVTNCLIGEKYVDEINELKELGVETLTLKGGSLIDEEIRYHADINAFNFGNGHVLLNSGATGEDELKKIGITASFYDKQICSPYPQDIPLNVAFTGNNIICNSNNSAKEIIDFAKLNNIEIIHTKQGYSKCNLCIVSENAAITEDEGLACLLKKYQFNVLLISTGDIYLSNKHYGFLGGASCKIAPDKMYFSGDLTQHKDYETIINFLDLYNVKPIFNKSRKLTDFGGIIQLTEKICRFK